MRDLESYRIAPVPGLQFLFCLWKSQQAFCKRSENQIYLSSIELDTSILITQLNPTEVSIFIKKFQPT